VAVTGSTRNRLASLIAGHVGSNPTLSAMTPRPLRSDFLESHGRIGKHKQIRHAERCPSWPKERDWKSRVLPKSGTEGSNPSLSAIPDSWHMKS
jgi:hypothetical protein